MKFDLCLYVSLRVDPPTPFADTSSLSIPQWGSFNPLFHIFKISSCLIPRNITIRLLDASESPATSIDKSREQQSIDNESLSDMLSILISSLTKLKRTGLSYVDKAAFLRLFQKKLHKKIV